MKNILVRCVGCGNVYEKGTVEHCPSCRFALFDDVLITIPMMEDRVIIDFKPLMSNFPKVFGLQITGRN